MKQSVAVLIVGLALSGCALKSDVRRLEDQLADMRVETARADSARAVTLARILDQLTAVNGELQDSLRAQRLAITELRGDFRTDVTQVLRNLVAMQELMGQNQAGLNELRRQVDRRLQEIATQPPPAAGDTTAARPAPQQRTGPEELFQIGIQQYRQSSVNTARMAFQMVVDSFPEHPRSPDAMFFLAESFQEENPDSAGVLYELVVERYVQSGKAPTALYRLGLLAEQQGDERAALLNYRRLIATFPNSDEAELARRKIPANPPA